MLLTAAPANAHPHPQHRHHCTQLDRIWSPARWRRGQPKPEAVKAFRDCPRWSKLKHRFYRHRQAELFRTRVTPYRAPDGTPLALPWPIVQCESGGRFHDPSAPNGGYSLLTGPIQGVPTWETWRPAWASGYAAPYQAPKKAQDIAAHRLLVAYGLSPWECAGMVGLG